tara:strand:- start:357 stop:677 length:321 start_codon:yes stop_codon:yes gene_type:complete
LINYLKTLCLIAAPVLAVSCSIRFFGSEEDANIATQNYMLDAIYSDQVSVVSVGAGETKKIRFAMMCTRRPEEKTFVCEERNPKKQEMTLKEWENLKVSYSYFRYR